MTSISVWTAIVCAKEIATKSGCDVSEHCFSEPLVLTLDDKHTPLSWGLIVAESFAVWDELESLATSILFGRRRHKGQGGGQERHGIRDVTASASMGEKH